MYRKIDRATSLGNHNLILSVKRHINSRILVVCLRSSFLQRNLWNGLHPRCEGLLAHLAIRS